MTGKIASGRLKRKGGGGGWLKRYAEQRYQLVDPVLRQMNICAEPFRWSELRAAATPAALKVLDEAAGFGLKDGFALPIYGAEGSVIRSLAGLRAL